MLWRRPWRGSRSACSKSRPDKAFKSPTFTPPSAADHCGSSASAASRMSVLPARTHSCSRRVSLNLKLSLPGNVTTSALPEGAKSRRVLKVVKGSRKDSLRTPALASHKSAPW